MKITTDHSASSYGRPVILDGRGEPMDYAPGFAAVRHRLGMTQSQMAVAIGKSRRTIENYEQGRHLPPHDVLYALAEMLGQEADAR